MNKRIQREINYIKDNMSSYEIKEVIYNKSYNENSNQIPNLNTYIEIITPNRNKLVFKLTKDYPFKVPEYLKINDINYRHSIKNMPKRIDYLYYHPNDVYFQEKSQLKLYDKPNCLCCSTLLCEGNWTPVCTIYYILNELNNHNNIKRYIKYKLMLKEIVDYFNLPLEFIRQIYVFCNFL